MSTNVGAVMDDETGTTMGTDMADALMRPLAQRWAEKVTGCVRDVRDARRLLVESILTVGRTLIAAKNELPHGAWQAMFKGQPGAVERPIPFSVGKAQKLMAIARHALLGKAEHARLLPPSWDTLYRLTTVDPAVLELALVDGRVHPTMGRKDVAALLASQHPWDSMRDPLNRALAERGLLQAAVRDSQRARDAARALPRLHKIFATVPLDALLDQLLVGKDTTATWITQRRLVALTFDLLRDALCHAPNPEVQAALDRVQTWFEGARS